MAQHVNDLVTLGLLGIGPLAGGVAGTSLDIFVAGVALVTSARFLRRLFLLCLVSRSLGLSGAALIHG